MSVLPDLSSRELRAICTIAECGSLVAASLTLNVSQPALTRTLQRVERAIGVELFRRSTRRLEVTPAGREFIALATRVLNDLRISVESMREITDEQRGQVIVSVVMSVAYTQLPLILAKYRESRPRIELQVREGVHGTVLEDVRSGVADLGVTYIDNLQGEFEGISLGTDALHVVMPAGHPLTAKAAVTLDKVAAYALVSLPTESQTTRLLEGLASAAGLTLRQAVTVNHFATVMQCVHAGVGIAIVPGGAVPAALSAGLVSRSLAEPTVIRTMGALLLQQRSLTPSARGFLEHLQQYWSPNTRQVKDKSSRSKR